MNKDDYVCAFRGRRDSYQVPLALAEAGLLNQFITDVYATPPLEGLARLLPRSLQKKLTSRKMSGIPVERVRCLWGNTFLEHARHKLGFSKDVTWMKLDQGYSLAAASRARRERANLFLYSPYAWEAFVARYAHVPRKVLFQYHPHPATEDRILSDDASRFPPQGTPFHSPHGGDSGNELRKRESEAWRHADLIFCASRFTMLSLVNAGCPEERCRVVPYGIDLPEGTATVAPPSRFRVIFVGTGVRRKGLHHLLQAWRLAHLPASSELLLVCRSLDEELERVAAGTPRTRVCKGLDSAELQSAYADSTLFAMPSLVEGFGQVFLEALAAGCPVLGTENTALPDLGEEKDGVFLTEPGNIDALTARLEALALQLVGNASIRDAARSTAARFSWKAFREGIRRELKA